MILANKNFKFEDTLDRSIALVDSFVVGANKIGHGHGEAKLYVASKDEMHSFFGDAGFKVKCFMLRSDLLSFLHATKTEYLTPRQGYINAEKLPEIWNERLAQISKLDEVIFFTLEDQNQILGPRGYVNSNDEAYQLLRTLCMPNISYLSLMRVKSEKGETLFYAKLFLDYEAMPEVPYSQRYGNAKTSEPTPKKTEKAQYEARERKGQNKYRADLLEECPFCPITMVTEERLLIASHIKPRKVSTAKEKVDPKNGFMLSPLYDKLFDIGFITFTSDRHMIVSNWLNPQNRKRLSLKNNVLIQRLPLDDQREHYLEYHRQFVFKG